MDPNLKYNVRLHFAEFESVGQRRFNVDINGVRVLTEFNIDAGAGYAKAVVRDFGTRPNSNGDIVVAFSAGTEGVPAINAIELDPVIPRVVDAGGPTTGPYGDIGYTGGSTSSTTNTIDTSDVEEPVPSAHYQTQRWGTSFTYTGSQLLKGRTYRLRLHFAEFTKTAAGQRLFDVALNGQTVLADFDVFAAGGGQNKGLVREFFLEPDAQGTIVATFSTTRDPNLYGYPVVNGIEFSLAATTKVIGNLSLPAGATGRDGGVSALVGDNVLYFFGDTFATGCNFTGFVNNTAALGSPFNQHNLLLEPTICPSSPIPTPFLLYSSAEAAYSSDPAHPGRRYVLWPGSIVRAPDGSGIVYYLRATFQNMTLIQNLGIYTGRVSPGSTIATRDVGPSGDFEPLFSTSDGLLFAGELSRNGFTYAHTCTGAGLCYVARAPEATQTQRSTWTFWNGSSWDSNLTNAAIAFLSTDTVGGNIHWNEYVNSYVLVQSGVSGTPDPVRPGVVPLLSHYIRTAPEPQGPWSAPRYLAKDGFFYFLWTHSEIRIGAGQHLHQTAVAFSGEITMRDVILP